MTFSQRVTAVSIGALALLLAYGVRAARGDAPALSGTVVALTSNSTGAIYAATSAGDFLRYNPINNTWQTLASIPVTGVSITPTPWSGVKQTYQK